MLISAAAAREQVLPCFPVTNPQIVIQGLPCDLRQLEPDGTAGLALPHGGAVNRVAVGCYDIDAECDQVTAAQLAVDGEIEQREVARTTFQVELIRPGADSH